MEEDFESQFEDEIDALNDIEDEERISTNSKPRRSLQFETPKAKSSLLRPSDGTPLSPVFDNQVVTLSQKKRLRERGSQSDSDLEYDDEDLNTTAPATKRPKIGVLNQQDEDELWNDDFLPTPKSAIKAKTLHNSITKPGKSHSSGKCADSELECPMPESPDRRLMERILEHRNRHTAVQESHTDTETDRNDRLVNDFDFERQRVFRRIPGHHYLATTGSEGNRVYMKLRDDAEFEKQLLKLGRTGRKGNLLSVSISALREQLEEERQGELLAESQRISDEVHRQLEEDPRSMDDDDDDELSADKENREPEASDSGAGNQVTHTALWVDRYTPQRYTDLLSEESINRSLLHWLRLWDYVVFNKELPIKPKEKKKEEPSKKFNKFNKFEVSDELDQYKRPQHKVALLCGPPGLGKTTLAHIIARHAGYNVVEMNASDDRSADIFKTRIENATQMKAVLGDHRPNCLVIDEIDGAPQAAINVLLGVVRKTEAGEEGRKKRKDEGGVLRRPIVCICNDQYVPALRQLRQVAMVMNFPQTDPSKLAGRLYEITRLEKLRSDMNTLLTLCEKTDNDIRSCLNTLQFIKGRRKELTMSNVQSMAVGQKDANKSLFSVWYDVLSLPKPKRQKFVNLQQTTGVKDAVLNTSKSARFRHVLSVVQAAGEYEKMTQGLFENYLECKCKDPYMEAVSLATDWLCFNDELTQYIQHQQDYRLMPYLPYLPVTYHLLFASNQPPKIQYPHSAAECNQRRVKCENLVGSMTADMCASIRTFINVTIVVSDVLPNLLYIMQPTFRPVNTQLYSAKEKETLHELVSTMISYNMTYTQEKSPEGQYNYVLDPHVDEVVKFPGMKQHKQLSYASKQLVAREIELEKMRRSELARAPPALQEMPSTESGSRKAEGGGDQKAPVVPNHLQRLTVKPLGKQETETHVKDFFGRVIKKTPESKTSTTDKAGNVEAVKKNVLATDIWFHFQGGYSNAVRRNVKIKEFL